MPRHGLGRRPGQQPGPGLGRQHGHRRQAGRGQRGRRPSSATRSRVEHVAGTFSTTISGGDAIYAGGCRCSLGFNVRSGSTYYFLTAGHCANIGATWYTNSARTTCSAPAPAPASRATTTASSATPTPVTPRRHASAAQDITSAGTAAVGQTVTRRGSTTGIHSGRVTALNATVNYAEGTVSGLIRTTVCAEPRRQRRPALLRHHRARPDLRRQRQLLLRRHDLLPAGHRGAERLRRQRLLIHRTATGRRVIPAARPRAAVGRSMPPTAAVVRASRERTPPRRPGTGWWRPDARPAQRSGGWRYGR